MNLPPEIPKELVAVALQLPELEDGEAAWAKADALAVIASLWGTTVPVERVVVAEPALWGYALSEDAWSCERYEGEADTDYALRSRSGAAEFVRRHGDEVPSVLFVLGFPMVKDAA